MEKKRFHVEIIFEVIFIILYIKTQSEKIKKQVVHLKKAALTSVLNQGNLSGYEHKCFY